MAVKPSKNAPATVETAADPSRPFVHRWNDLVSTTNWEKGHIICQWRESLQADGALPGDYSDDTWAERVGGVTGQHVGRLRRVFQRFGDVYSEYSGLYWSHFQVAIDWDDAEMWLEGAVQSGWSVSQMRAQRWETHGAPADKKPRDEDVIVSEVDEDAGSDATGDDAQLSPRSSQVRGVGDEVAGGGKGGKGDRHLLCEAPEGPSRQKVPVTFSATATERKRPFADLPALPDDLAEAFDEFKLVILAHKMAGWTEISRDDLLACLDALKELALQPADD